MILPVGGGIRKVITSKYKLNRNTKALLVKDDVGNKSSRFIATIT